MITSIGLSRSSRGGCVWRVVHVVNDWLGPITSCPAPPLPLPLQIVVVNQNLHAILQKSHHMQRIREMFGSKRRALRPLAGLAEEQVRSYCFCLCYLWEENEEERG